MVNNAGQPAQQPPQADVYNFSSQTHIMEKLDPENVFFIPTTAILWQEQQKTCLSVSGGKARFLIAFHFFRAQRPTFKNNNNNDQQQ